MVLIIKKVIVCTIPYFITKITCLSKESLRYEVVSPSVLYDGHINAFW